MRQRHHSAASEANILLLGVVVIRKWMRSQAIKIESSALLYKLWDFRKIVIIPKIILVTKSNLQEIIAFKTVIVQCNMIWNRFYSANNDWSVVAARRPAFTTVADARWRHPDYVIPIQIASHESILPIWPAKLSTYLSFYIKIHISIAKLIQVCHDQIDHDHLLKWIWFVLHDHSWFSDARTFI